VRLATDHGFQMATPPRGLFGWVEVGADTDRLAQRLLDDGWLIAPGSLFHATPRPTTLMRVNFSTTQDPVFWQRLRQRIGVSSHL
jgi:DNA-binding transcriptional MocR family regulator